MTKTKTPKRVSIQRIAPQIYWIRGVGVMLDRDLAAMYGVKAIALRQAVKRNADRFPDDFLMRLTEQEIDLLVSQSVIPSRRSLGGTRADRVYAGGDSDAVKRASQ